MIVTYNRKKMLLDVLDALIAQRRKLDGIILVDNASSDGTLSAIQESGYFEYAFNSTDVDKDVELHLSYEISLQSDYCETLRSTQMHFFRLPENSGGAGGFKFGMNAALSLGADLIWLMDDDGYPGPTCLDVLLSAYNGGREIIGPVILDRELNNRLAFNINYQDIIYDKVNILNLLPDSIPGVLFPFNGTLIPSFLVKEIGLPRDYYFLWGDEVEYTLRAKANGAKIATIRDAYFYHVQKNESYKRIEILNFGFYVSEIKKTRFYYYFLRNKLDYLPEHYGFKFSIRFISAEILKGIINKDKVALVSVVFSIVDLIRYKCGGKYGRRV